jgi:hypothetical protein
LLNGDVVGVGKHELKYINEQATASDTDFEKTMIIRPGMANQTQAAIKKTQEKAEKVAAASGQAVAVPEDQLPLGKVQVLSGPATGKELELRKALTTLGRPGVQVAVITRRPQGYFITHVEGTQPVVNGQPTGAQAHPLRDNDVIELAGVKMEFFVLR